MVEVKVGETVEDFALYPRDRVDDHHVRDIAVALENGSELPPIIIDQKTKRVVDGFHRRRAYIKAFGEEHKIEVVSRRYKTEADIFMEAIKYNASHGLKMDSHDRVTAVIRGGQLGLDIATIGKALHVPEAKLQKLVSSRTAKTKLAQPKRNNGTRRTAGQDVAIKRTIQHRAGDTLTEEQLEANEKLSGMSQSFYVNQVVMLIESDLLNTADEKLMDRLSHLHGLLEGLLAK